MADAAFVFVNDTSYLLGCLPLRPETTVIQLWHACGAFKKFGYSIAEKKYGASRRELERYPLYNNFSYVTVSSPEVVWAYAEAFHMEERQERILPVGIPRTDCFYDKERIRLARKKLETVFPQAAGRSRDEVTAADTGRGSGKKIVLYAPTFRGNSAHAVSPELPDFTKLHKILGDDFLFLVKHHPFVKQRAALPEKLSGFVRDVTDQMEIDELLMVSDVCMTDYSSLVFEFALFERPLLFYAPDLDEYNDWRGFYYPYEEITPGPVVRRTEEIADYLLHLSGRFDRQQVSAFRSRFMEGCDGHASDRVVALVRKIAGNRRAGADRLSRERGKEPD